jgi:F-type H+-transporting ATPase subunit epsilon
VALTVDLVSAEQREWSGDASEIIARSVEGDLGIMTGHTPLLAVLAPGDVTITDTSGDETVITVDGGFLSVESDQVLVVVEQVKSGEKPAASRRGSHDG